MRVKFKSNEKRNSEMQNLEINNVEQGQLAPIKSALKSIFTSVRLMRISFVLPAIGLIAGCSGTPGPADIEPYVQGEVGSCPLWTVSNIKKTDGEADGNNYRLDISAELTLKGSSDETSTTYKNNGFRPEFKPCHAYIMHMYSKDGQTLSQKFVIEGFAIFTKTEKGWRVIQNWTPTAVGPA
jgi:hypothetical protein